MYMLNKHGWSLREMLILSGILIVFLFIAVYYIFTMYRDLDLEIGNNHYSNLEEKLEENAIVYLEDYYEGDLNSEGLKITRGMLRSYDLDVELRDKDGHVCAGYVMARRTHGEDDIKAYISCSDYTTEGFE
mgnify:FL=1